MSLFVRSSDLASALGITRKTLARWVARGKVPPPTGEPGEWHRWPLASAVEILTARGCPVPASWSGEKVAA